MVPWMDHQPGEHSATVMSEWFRNSFGQIGGSLWAVSLLTVTESIIYS